MDVLRPWSVLPDSNIWVSQTLHSWFALLAAETIGSWTFHWTEDIMAEAVKGRRRRFPESSSRSVENVRDRLIRILGENRISGFPYDASVTYPDRFDAHVHSAAVYAGVSMVVTENIKDFDSLYHDPDDRPYDLFTADEWLMLAADTAPEQVDSVIRQQLNYWQSRNVPFNLVKKLQLAGCPGFGEYVRKRLQQASLS